MENDNIYRTTIQIDNEVKKYIDKVQLYGKESEKTFNKKLVQVIKEHEELQANFIKEVSGLKEENKKLTVQLHNKIADLENLVSILQHKKKLDERAEEIIKRNSL